MPTWFLTNAHRQVVCNPVHRRGYRTFLCMLGLLLSVLGWVSPANAAYPDKPIRWVVPSLAGSPIDTIARRISDAMAKTLGQPIIVENKPGAYGSIGAEQVARSSPDGYTFLFSISDPIIAATVVVPGLRYQPLRDLVPVSKVTTGAAALLASARLNAANLSELVNEAKAANPELNYGSFGHGSYPHQILHSFAQQSGIQLANVPYRGSPAAVQDLVGGRISMTMAAPSYAASLIAEGKVRILAVTGPKRIPTLPDVKTFAEQGYKGFVFESPFWTGLFAPAGVSREVLAQTSIALQNALKDDAIVLYFRSLDIQPVGSAPEEFLADLQKELTVMPDVIRSLGEPK